LKRIALLLIVQVTFLIGCNQQQSAERSGSEVSAKTEFDVVVLNGRVIDPETKLDAVRNIGINNGTISIITETTSQVKRLLMRPAK
jgi:adenine deaminase